MIYEIYKRTSDIFLALFLAILFSPFLVFVPILIRLETHGPILYRQRRVGKNGKPFWIYKFRSMIDGADEYLLNKRKLWKGKRKLWEELRKNDWKMENDPRITKVGRLIRSLTIDEFPQLWNILKGEMSLIGPRVYREVELDEQVKIYPETKEDIEWMETIKPGITGPWQVSGRNEIPFIKRVKMDAEYARLRAKSPLKAIARDIDIIFKTPMAMISKW